MKTAKTYGIICRTDSYHGSVKSDFNHNFTHDFAYRVHAEHLTIKEAYDMLLAFFSEEVGGRVSNWGRAVRGTYGTMTAERQDIIANATDADGLRSYTNDIYTYQILPQEEIDDIREDR